MNFTNALTSPNGLLLLLGLILLVAGSVLRALWLWRGHPQAGGISVVTVLVACVLVAVSLFRVTFPALAGEAPATQIASATAAPADRGIILGVSSATSEAASTGKPASSGVTAASSDTETIPPNQFLPLIALVGSGVTLFFGTLMYLSERHQPGFNPSASPGLLYAGAAVFVLILSVIVPNLPGQFTTAQAKTSGIAAVGTTGLLPTRIGLAAATPSVTPLPSSTPTALPSLTPTQNSSPTPLFTAIAYAASTDTGTTVTNCTVTAQTLLNLRGDPSTRQQAIGRVFAGSLLPVTGQSYDQKWWRVVSSDGGSPIEGWVSADFVMPGSGCSGDPILAVGPTLTPSRTPVPTRTPVPSRTPFATSTAKPSATCVVMTMSVTSLRAGPDIRQTSLVEIPRATALNADGQSKDGLWWHVSYATQSGWVSGDSVFAASTCASIATMATVGVS